MSTDEYPGKCRVSSMQTSASPHSRCAPVAFPCRPVVLPMWSVVLPSRFAAGLLQVHHGFPTFSGTFAIPFQCLCMASGRGTTTCLRMRRCKHHNLTSHKGTGDLP